MKKINTSLFISSFIIVFLIGFFGFVRPMRNNAFAENKAEYERMQRQIEYWTSIKDRFDGNLLDNTEAREHIPASFEGVITWRMYAEALLDKTNEASSANKNSIVITDTQTRSQIITTAYEVRIQVTFTISNPTSFDIDDLLEKTYANKPLMLVREFYIVSNTQIKIEFTGFYA